MLCGGTRTSKHLLLECPQLKDARNDLLPAAEPLYTSTPTASGQPAEPATDITYNTTYTTAVISSLKRTGLGFSRDFCDKALEDESEIDDIDVGPIGSLSLDIDLRSPKIYFPCLCSLIFLFTDTLGKFFFSPKPKDTPRLSPYCYAMLCIDFQMILNFSNLISIVASEQFCATVFLVLAIYIYS